MTTALENKHLNLKTNKYQMKDKNNTFWNMELKQRL